MMILMETESLAIDQQQSLDRIKAANLPVQLEHNDEEIGMSDRIDSVLNWVNAVGRFLVFSKGKKGSGAEKLK